MLLWENYKSDLNRAYPLFALSVVQVNQEIESNIDPITLLPQAIASLILDGTRACAVSQLIPRQLVLWVSDGGQFTITYPEPFSQNLFDYLTATTQVIAFEFVGERLKYGRLKRLLDYVRS